MTTVAELLAKERAQDERMIQSALGKAIDQSFQSIIREPLSNRIALLLLQLGLAQAIDPRVDEARKDDTSALMDGPETELAKATRHVAKAKGFVSRQRERIVRLQAQNCPTQVALEMLDTFIKTLASMERHQRLLFEEAEHKDADAGWHFFALGRARRGRFDPRE